MAYSICKIKNLIGEIITLNGHEFQVDEIYPIQDMVRISWANSDVVIQAISSEDFEIHNGEGVISGISNQIDWLKQNVPINAVTEPTSRYSMKGIAVEVECAADDDTIIRLKIDNFAGESYTYKYLYGGEIFGENIEYGDSCRFYIEDYDNILGYGSEVEIKSFIEKAYLKPAPCPNHFRADCPARIPVGLYLTGVISTTSSGTTRKLYVNFDVHNKD